MAHIATHPGTVTAVSQGTVRVQIVSLSACASCQAHSRCGFAEAKEKELDIETRQWATYSPGQQVEVVISESRGLLAVLLAYVLPSLLLIGSLVGLLSITNEGLAALGSIGVVALWYGLLYLCRHRLQNKFTFEIRSL